MVMPAVTPTRLSTPTWTTATLKKRLSAPSNAALPRHSSKRSLAYEKVFAQCARIFDGAEHHAAAGPGVRAAGDFHHHHDSAGQGHGLEAAHGGQAPEGSAAQGVLHFR